MFGKYHLENYKIHVNKRRYLDETMSFLLQMLRSAENGIKCSNNDMLGGQRVKLLSKYLNEFDDKLPQEEIVELMHEW